MQDIVKTPNADTWAAQDVPPSRGPSEAELVHAKASAMAQDVLRLLDEALGAAKLVKVTSEGLKNGRDACARYPAHFEEARKVIVDDEKYIDFMTKTMDNLDQQRRALSEGLDAMSQNRRRRLSQS